MSALSMRASMSAALTRLLYGLEHSMAKRCVQNGPNKKYATESGDDCVHITDNCVRKLKKLAELDKQLLRVEVEGGGCSGFQYKFELVEGVNDDDRVFERDGVRVVVDETSFQYLKGSAINYNEELIKSSFRIENNPQSDHGCSCGASFSIKTDGFKF